MQNQDRYIEHAGVKGMKWGIRKRISAYRNAARRNVQVVNDARKGASFLGELSRLRGGSDLHPILSLKASYRAFKKNPLKSLTNPVFGIKSNNHELSKLIKEKNNAIRKKIKDKLNKKIDKISKKESKVINRMKKVDEKIKNSRDTSDFTKKEKLGFRDSVRKDYLLKMKTKKDKLKNKYNRKINKVGMSDKLYGFDL